MQIDPVDSKNSFRINVALKTKKVLFMKFKEFSGDQKNHQILLIKFFEIFEIAHTLMCRYVYPSELL